VQAPPIVLYDSATDSFPEVKGGFVQQRRATSTESPGIVD
jgi:hypothetical protein